MKRKAIVTIMASSWAVNPKRRKGLSRCSRPSVISIGEVVNVTLGLPYIRTSVDHGTALNLAGTGRATVGSLVTAVKLARRLTGAS